MSLTQELIALIRSKPVSGQDLEQAALFSLDAIACAYAGSATGVGRIYAAGRQVETWTVNARHC